MDKRPGFWYVTEKTYLISYGLFKFYYKHKKSADWGYFQNMAKTPFGKWI